MAFHRTSLRMSLRTLFSFALIGWIFFFSSCLRRAPEGMVGVEGGEFLMGTDEVDPTGFAAEQGIVKPWFVDEGPSHPVYLPPFYIDRYEVTNHQYAQFVRATGRPAPPHWEHGAPPPGSDFFPVAMIRWQEAQDYCRWRGGRLPTEAEWEKAARGTDGRRYPWGNDFDLQKANVGGVAKDLAPAGAFPESVSPYGALDMIGNVWEWTADWYQPYPGARYQSKEYGKRLKVIRGNSWSAIGHYPPEVQKELVKFHSTTTFRLYASPDEAINDVGFRCVQPGS